MITDGQVKELLRLLSGGKTLAAAARVTGMDEKTARKYRKQQKLPSQMKKPREVLWCNRRATLQSPLVRPVSSRPHAVRLDESSQHEPSSSLSSSSQFMHSHISFWCNQIASAS